MDREENALNDFRQELERIDGPLAASAAPNAKKAVAIHAWLRDYAIYPAFFVWTIILVAALRPSFLFRQDDAGKKRFLWKRFFLTVLLVFVGQVLVYLGVGFYQKRAQP
ncbi:hypothetical protein EBZ80_02155 [bacterium]|nr:hypothetical protein [bacterium]